MNRECWWCGKELDNDMKICADCHNYVAKNGYMPGMRDDERRQMAHECSMCGKDCQSIDENGHCSSCRQVWNS